MPAFHVFLQYKMYLTSFRVTIFGQCYINNLSSKDVFSLGHLHTNPGLIWTINHKIENVWERMASLEVITAAFNQGQWMQEQGSLTSTRGMCHCGLVSRKSAHLRRWADRWKRWNFCWYSGIGMNLNYHSELYLQYKRAVITINLF